jgi:hypothetical protein
MGDLSVTIDEELTVLESQLRRLKIEYEVYFSNPNKRPPTDVEWKVLGLLRKFSDGGRMSFSQRFRYNEMAQRYAVYSDLWRKKGRIREEGYRRPQDALLSVSGVRPEEHLPEHKVYGVGQAAAGSSAAVAPATIQAAGVPAKEPLRVECSDARAEQEKVALLYKALTEAKKNAGESVSGSMDSFASFVQKKTDQIRKQYGCATVEYSVEMESGQVRLKAKAKV